MDEPLRRWHELVTNRDAAGLANLLDNDVVFHSPALFKPLAGKPIVTQFLTVALAVIANDSFRYVREIVGDCEAMLEFECELDGRVVNGVDILTWSDAGKIIDFKVMVRPWSGLEALKSAMAKQLARQVSTDEMD